MIGLPLNDHACLNQVTELVTELVRQRDPVIVDLASKYPSTSALAAWIRSLPQRDDHGDPSDGPKADRCDPPQRVRIPAPDPNCVERAALYAAVAELLDPRGLRQLATIVTPAGRHTFVVEFGSPVVLDPSMPRNALEAGLFRMEDGPIAMTPEEQVDWIAGIAEGGAAPFRNGVRRVRNARDVMRATLIGRPIPPHRVPDVAFTLTIAEREARLFGNRGIAVHRSVQNAIGAAQLGAEARAHRNAPSVRFGKYRVTPHPAMWGTLGALARATGRVGVRAGAVAAQAYLAKHGVSPQLIHEVERELNRDGLSLGPLARASADRPLFGSLASLVG